ncbi:cell division protein FtsA [Thermoflavimicrobium dichotomicum]|uniref:Cell division protein FtsA n=1 Tax=Thermoflavimicrobium dichotomicum TaxID=46223 RepID=A0A1I3N5H7_9BACL|nr:cell division protein FtsA [Thermoflavimicrobium dichotomicum]SFJ04442.1 cell division protein FtsA [Thermoflavimicrobium dichotomicum]
MSSEDYIVTIDVGTSQIRVIVAEINSDGTTQIIGIGTAASQGMKKGSIVNIDHAVQSIRKAVEHAERMVGIEISEVYVGISGNHVSLQQSHGVVAVSSEDREIGLQDIERVMQAAKVIALPPERMIIEVIPKQFIVDGLKDIRDPKGMIGVRLEVDATIITGAKTMVQNLIRCVEKASLQVAGIVFLPLAISELCLSDDEKNLGCVLVDMGGGTTSLTIYQQGHLAGAAMIPIGGEYITNDIAFGLRTQSDVAEQIKVKYGCASREHATKNETFTVRMIGNSKEMTVTQLELAQIIEPRVTEMFQLIKEQVKTMGFLEEPPGGYVLTGGVMSTSHIIQVAQKQLGSAVRIATPENIGIKDPAYMGGISMIHYLQKMGRIQVPDSKMEEEARAKKARNFSPLKRVKTWLSEFI